MTTYSQSDWATRALQKASIVDAEETPSAALSDWAIEVGSSLFGQLSTKGIQVANGSEMALPGEYFQIFATYVACDLKAEVGLMSEADAVVTKEALENTFRKMNPIQPTGAVLQVDYF